MPDQDTNASSNGTGLLGITLDEGLDEYLDVDPQNPADAAQSDVSDETYEDDLGFEPDRNLDDEDRQAEPAEDDEGPDTSVDPEDEVLLEIDVDGERVPLTAKEVRSSYFRQKDYQAKTRHLADERRQVAEQTSQTQSELGALQAERVRYAQHLAVEADLISQAAGPAPERTSYQDEGTWAMAHNEWRGRRDQVEARQTEIRAVAEQIQLANSQRQLDTLQAEQAKVVDMYPEWKDVVIANEAKAKSAEYLREKGFSDQEMAGISDSRLVAILEDAKIGANVRAGRDKAVKKTAKARTFLKSEARSTRQTRKSSRSKPQLEERLDQTGSLDAGIDLLLAQARSETDGRRRST